jgi:hypothetical protein
VVLLRIVSRKWRVKLAVGMQMQDASVSQRDDELDEEPRAKGQPVTPTLAPGLLYIAAGTSMGVRWPHRGLVPSSPRFGGKESRGFARCAQMERGSSQTRVLTPLTAKTSPSWVHLHRCRISFPQCNQAKASRWPARPCISLVPICEWAP